MLHENVLAPGELLTAVVLPPLTAGQQSMYRKVRARTAWDFALAGVAVAVKMTDRHVELARLVLSGVAPIPWRAIEAEKVLTGNRLDTETIARTAAASVAGARPLTYNGYKVDLVRGLVEETLQALT
jgi:xanthine dehydrogenase YagS FAD-binding subunit